MVVHNHGLMMILCCGIPMASILVAVYVFGLNSAYLFWP